MAAKQALTYDRTGINSLRMLAARQASAQIPESVPLDEPWTPSEVAQWQPDLSMYDLLGVANRGQ